MEFVAYDIETTGTDPDVDQIVEVGAVRFEANQPTSGFSSLVDPGRLIPPDAIQVHGITDDMVAGKPRIEEVLDDFADFCGERMLVAYNASFDFKFLLGAIKAHEAPAPKGVSIDSFALAKRMVPGLPNYRLDTLVRHFGIEQSHFHRAEADAACCGLVFARLLGYLEANNMPTTVASLIELTGQKELVFPRFEQGPQQLGLLL